jgi:hypothetical protein
MYQGRGRRHLMQAPVCLPAEIFPPCHLMGIGAEDTFR